MIGGRCNRDRPVRSVSAKDEVAVWHEGRIGGRSAHQQTARARFRVTHRKANWTNRRIFRGRLVASMRDRRRRVVRRVHRQHKRVGRCRCAVADGHRDGRGAELAGPRGHRHRPVGPAATKNNIVVRDQRLIGRGPAHDQASRRRFDIPYGEVNRTG